MTEAERIDRLPLDELLQPVRAKDTPLRCRYALGVSEPMDDGQLSTAISSVALMQVRTIHKRKIRKRTNV